MEDFGLGYKASETVIVASIPQHLTNGDEVAWETVKDGLTTFKLFYENFVPSCLKPDYVGSLSAEEIAITESNMAAGVIKLSINSNSYLKIFSAEETANLKAKGVLKLHEIGLDNETALETALSLKDEENAKLLAEIELLKAQLQSKPTKEHTK